VVGSSYNEKELLVDAYFVTPSPQQQRNETILDDKENLPIIERLQIPRCTDRSG
jgi:hypothetical protein